MCSLFILAAQLKESSENEKAFLKLVTEGDIVQLEKLVSDTQ